MPLFTLIFGILLILLGILSFVFTGSIHITALIPAMLGVPIGLLGLLARKTSLRKHTMHAAVLIVFLGFLGGLSRLYHLPELLRKTSFHLPPAQIASILLVLLCLIYIIIAIYSFIKARRQRNN